VSAPEVRLTRRYRFSAAHRLHSELLTAEENRDVFGKCNNPYGHGHDYRLEVTVRGVVDKESGLVADVRRLDTVVQREILDHFHLRNLNVDVAEFSTLVPTSENVAVVVERRLSEIWEREFPSGPTLARVRLEETRRNRFELTAKVPGARESQAGRAGILLAEAENQKI
jgi:6-pyruvoyltetrahydropterin/6-carboxytetrahydropterin synthase